MSINLAVLYHEHGLVAKSKTHNELCGPCPWCGGKDRFTIFTDQGNNGLGRYWCRQCGKGGDTIQFVRETQGLGFKEAVEYLGLPSPQGKVKLAANNLHQRAPAFEPITMPLPSEKWRTKAEAIATWAKGQLQNSTKVKEWLIRERGIMPKTALSAGLGWIPEDMYRPREAFGLEPEIKKNGKPRRVWIPKGISIPVFNAQGQLLRLKFRVADAGAGRPKYIPLPQAEKNTSPLILPAEGPELPLQVVESELDAILLHQHCFRLVNVVALGSASYRPDTETWRLLCAAPLVLVSLDYDDAGNKAAFQWWETNLPPGLFKLWPVPVGKDPCDSWKAGYSLMEWTHAGIFG